MQNTPASDKTTATLKTGPNHHLSLSALFHGGLFFLALFAALYVAQEIIVPIVLAFMMKLVLQPFLRSIEHYKIPRSIAAFIIIWAMVAGIAEMGNMLSQPMMQWAEKLPTAITKLQTHLSVLNKPMESLQHLLVRAESMTQQSGPRIIPVAVEGNRLSDHLLHGTGALITGAFTTLLVLFFLILSGDTFLRRLVEVLPSFHDKRQAVTIAQHIESDVSAYLFTITCMNLAVGVCTGLVMLLYGNGDALLWGTIAFLLNYIPIVGPFVGIGIFLLAGLMTQTDFNAATMPAIAYLIIHIMEGSFITPRLLARRFTLNPVLVILSLIFWFWLWGIPGAILSVPILAITKIICDRIERLSPIGHFIGVSK